MILKLKFLILGIFFFCQSTIVGDSLLFVIRVDDIQSRNTTMVPRSILPFESAVQQRGGKVTWAVIPHRLIESQNVNGVLQNELRESITRGHEIALHGYNHICPICGNSGHEMFCPAQNYNIPYSQQKDSLIKGLSILLDSLNVIPTCFVPPGHHQDSTTFQVLLDLEIGFLSSNGQTKNFIYKDLFNLKSNNEYTWQLTQTQYQQNLKNALTDIRTTGKSNGYYCLLLHDPFIREGYNNEIVILWIGELLDSLNLEYGNIIKYKTLSETAEIFKTQITRIVSVDLLENQYKLFQNYPNPFNPATLITYQLLKGSNVTLKVYDILGKEVTTLLDNEWKESGLHSVEFKSSEHSREIPLSSGLYFYQLRAGETIKTNKMLLLR